MVLIRYSNVIRVSNDRSRMDPIPSIRNPLRSLFRPAGSFLALLLVCGAGLSPARAQQEFQSEAKKEEFKSFSNTNINLGGMQPELRSPDSEAGEIRWSPQTGYYTVGGTLGGLQPEYAQEALDLMNRARASEVRGNERSALKDYKRVYKDYPASQYAPEARFRTASIFLDRGRYDRAFEELDIVLRGYPSYGKFNLLLGQQYEIASAYVNGHRRKILGFLPGWTNRDRGVQYFERLVFNAPFSDYAPLSLMSVAVTQLNQRNYAYAIDALDRLINAYPNSMVTSDAYLKLAETHGELVDGPLYDQGATREAISYFEDYLILFPRGSGLEEAEEGLDEMKEILSQSKFKMAEFYYKKRRNYAAAKVFYNEAITVAPNSQTAATSRTRLDEMEGKTEALREKQAEWLTEQIRKIDEGAARNAAARSAGQTAPTANPADASIDSEPAETETPASPEATPSGDESRDLTSGTTEPEKPKRKFLGIF